MAVTGHSHGEARHASGGARHRRNLSRALVLIGTFFVVELVAALWTGSLALLGDAGHMLTDVLGLGMALAAITAAASRRSMSSQRSFGLYRLEILAALANAVLLLGVAGYVLYEAVSRLAAPPEVTAGPMLVVAVGGLLVNLAAFRLLREGASESLNVRGAYLEVMADTLASIGAIVAGTIMVVTGWAYADPLVALGIGVFIAPRAWRLGGEALRILLQAAPANLPVAQVREELSRIEDVLDVHDMHVWTLTSEMEVVSAHLVIAAGGDPHATLDRARDLLQGTYGVTHATLQVEPDDHQGCDELHW
ncbi:MAG: cation diffusion facilitator family transporter [Nitriliruptorales bacterium]|nr:cation diffusion facilitator family transporter [Nitriliruptorales bacterium]